MDHHQLERYYYQENYSRFLESYQSEKSIINTRLHHLAAKTFQELNRWEDARTALKAVIPIGNEIEKLEAKLSLANLELVIEKLSRQNAFRLLEKCEAVKQEISEDHLFPWIISLRVKATLVASGLASAKEKEALITGGIKLLFSARDYPPHQRMALLQLLMSICIGNPRAHLKRALELYEKYQHQFPNQELMLNLVQSSKLIAELQTIYIEPKSLSPKELPKHLEEVKTFLVQNRHAYPNALVSAIYGEHLLDLEFKEGIEWVKKALPMLWANGSKQKVISLKNKCIHWLQDRGHTKEVPELTKTLAHYQTAQTVPFSHDLNIISKANIYFIQGNYPAGEQYLASNINKVTNEANRIHLISLLVNSSSKINRTNRNAIQLLENEIKLLGIEDSVLHAQLLSFLAIVYPKHQKAKLFKQSAETYLNNGYIEEAFQQYKNYLSEIGGGGDGNFANEYTEQVNRLDRIFSSDKWIKYPASTQASIFQNIGQTHISQGNLAKGLEVLKLASVKFKEAHHLRAFAINNQYLILACIQQGRRNKDLTSYINARRHAKEAMPILEKNEIADFLWRLYFHYSICFSEPLRYRLIPEGDLDEYKSQASHYLYQALYAQNQINDYTATLPNDQRIFALSKLTSEAHQLVFSGFYFFLEDKAYKECIAWLEASRNLIASKGSKQGYRDYVYEVQQELKRLKKPLDTQWFTYYYLHRTEAYVFLFNQKHDDPLFVKIDGSETLLAELEQITKNEGLILDSKAYYRLNAFIAPILSNIPRDVPICIIPYGDLQDVPFHFLGEDKPLTCRNSTYYHYSLNLWLKEKKSIKNPDHSIRIFADPLANLKSALEEGQLIADLYKTTPAKRGKVSKKVFLKSLKTHSILHFAGHGRGTKSENLKALRIELGAGDYITAQDLINEQNTSELVVLGACITGYQTLLGGEEKASIPYALIISGVSAVISSRWVIDDEEALQFFISFYKELIKSKNVLDAYRYAFSETVHLESVKGLVIHGLPMTLPYNSSWLDHFKNIVCSDP
ncbi:MAG: CHAT domain-containing protein [Bacteroidota bacterium]